MVQEKTTVIGWFTRLATPLVTCGAMAMVALSVIPIEGRSNIKRNELDEVMDRFMVTPAGVNLEAECDTASYCVVGDTPCTSYISSRCGDGEEEEDTGNLAFECFDEDNICDTPFGPLVVCTIYRGPCYWNPIGICALTPELDENGEPTGFYEDEVNGYSDCENWL